MEIEVERKEDWWEVEALFDLCFAPGRTALSSYRLRDDIDPVRELCLVMRDYGAVVAAIRYWPILVGGKPALLMGPVATHPTRQGEGIAAYIIQESLARARAAGHEWVVLVGDYPYYKRFNFLHAPNVEFPPPTNPDRVLAQHLVRYDLEGLEGLVTRFDDVG